MSQKISVVGCFLSDHFLSIGDKEQTSSGVRGSRGCLNTVGGLPWTSARSLVAVPGVPFGTDMIV